MTPAAVSEHNLSVLRSAFSEPDHARWQSADDTDGPPQVFRDWAVIQISVASIPPALVAEAQGSKVHEFRAVHVPFEDNYAHSELRAFKDGAFVADQNKMNKRVRALLKHKLADAAAIRLLPNQITDAADSAAES